MDPQINLDRTIYHMPCAKCADCNCQITISNCTISETTDNAVLLCKVHYLSRINEVSELAQRSRIMQLTFFDPSFHLIRI